MGASAKKCDKGKDPKTCSPEQVRKCHGTEAVHPCGAGTGKKK
jgi:hypothetical protein